MKETYSAFVSIIWLFIFAVSIEKTTCFHIERKVISKSTLPYPSADNFGNPVRALCYFRLNSCNKYGAKCSRTRSCCTCECRGHTPNFFSSSIGCLSSYSLGTKAATSCRYVLKNSGGLYVPTFTSHTDFDAMDIILNVNPDSLQTVLMDGNCKASAVSYINGQGRKRLLFKNRCSEIFEIEKKFNEDKEAIQLLKWRWKASPQTYFHKMQGKLLRLDIRCESTRRTIDSCLLFKVGGSYNDLLTYTSVESPRVCPSKDIYTSTTKPDYKVTKKLKTKRTTTIKVPTEEFKSKAPTPATSSPFETDGPVIEHTTGPTPDIHPPASLPDIETVVPNTEGTSPDTGTTALETDRTAPDRETTAPINGPSTNDAITDAPSTAGKQDKNESSNSQASLNVQKNNNHGINWLVTGLIIAVAVLLVTLAASLFVLLRKRCKKRAQRNSGEFAMNVVYHGSPAGPEYDEATLPPKRDYDDDQMHCYNDGNLYESIDNLNVKGATADTYEYAYSDASKVDLPDENANKEQPRPPTVPRPSKNQYEVAFRMKSEHVYNTPGVEEYEDMTLASSEEAPLCTKPQDYVNIREGARESVESDIDEQSNEVYEEMVSTEPTESEPLVPESYIAPDATFKQK